MRCNQAKKWFFAYLDDELDPGRQAALDAHLASCPDCAADLGRVKERWSELRAGLEDPGPALPADLWGRIQADLDGSERQTWYRRNRGRLLQAACVAACVVLGFTGGALLSWEGPPAKRAQQGAEMGVLVAEAFDATSFGLNEGQGGLLTCAPE